MLILETDASDSFWGVVLKAVSIDPENLQKEEEILEILKEHKSADELICGYNSEKFKPNELNYIIFEKELLAIKNGIKRFQIYLAPIKFLIRTDNKVVRDFLKKKRVENNYRRVKCSNYISQYSFEIVHINTNKNILADYLSRHPNGY